MKKTGLSILTAISLFAFSACASKEPISEKKALDVALKDANLTTSDVTVLEQSYDKEDNQYDFSFQTTTEKFDYEIDGENGNILSKEKETLKGVTTNNDTNTSATTDDQGNTLSEEQWTYLNLALTHFQVNKDEITNAHVQLDHEDGIQVYDVKFYKGQVEYSCDIRVDNQTIVNSEIDQN